MDPADFDGIHDGRTNTKMIVMLGSSAAYPLLVDRNNKNAQSSNRCRVAILKVAASKYSQLQVITC